MMTTLICRSVSSSSTCTSIRSSSTGRNVDEKEVLKFSRNSGLWWDSSSSHSISNPFSMLHKMNPARMEYIMQQCILRDSKDSLMGKSLNSWKVLDVGCGGGILTKSLSLWGQFESVMGIDASQENIRSAQGYATSHPLLEAHVSEGRLSFEATMAESLVESGKRFDLVCCLEVLEHVPDPNAFIGTLAKLLDENGILVLSTINDSFFSKTLATTVAERLLGLLEPGTHDPNRFLALSRIQELGLNHNLNLINSNSLVYVPFPDSRFVLQPWYHPQFTVNYLATLKVSSQHETIN